MPEENSKKSYYLPEKLMECFKEWCAPGREYSPKIAGAVLAIMACDNFALVKKLSELAYKDDIETSKIEAKKLITRYLLDAEALAFLHRLPPSAQKEVLADAKRYKDRPIRKK